MERERKRVREEVDSEYLVEWIPHVFLASVGNNVSRRVEPMSIAFHWTDRKFSGCTTAYRVEQIANPRSPEEKLIYKLRTKGEVRASYSLEKCETE